ncbi:TIR domain-containing protein [Candidatus Magnetomonas plexicatena]|uniref:TIR domain-containing protein n=1 Tax=Candidatus Magnetomonas plexicatena TaxID=2552947 RepID=UPI004032F081
MNEHVRRKVFISYYHKEDERYRELFEIQFGHLFINKSVPKDEISDDNSTNYIKRLIQTDYLKDTSVVVVLVGQNTYTRKHVDWEISAGLSNKVGGPRSYRFKITYIFWHFTSKII